MSANDLIVPEQSTIVRENALWSSAVVQSTLNQNFAWQPLQSATKNTACAYAFVAYPSPSPTDKRPQLNEAQAAHFLMTKFLVMQVCQEKSNVMYGTLCLRRLFMRSR
jgi:hypothetical protein